MRVAPRQGSAAWDGPTELILVRAEVGPGSVRLADRIAQPTGGLAQGDPILEPADPGNGEGRGAADRLRDHRLPDGGAPGEPRELARGVGLEQRLWARMRKQLDGADGPSGSTQHDG